MLKASGSAESLTWPGEGGVRVGGNSRAGHDKSKLDESAIGDDEVDEINDEDRKKDQNPTKSKNLSKSKKTELGFLISGARIAFTELRQAFVKALILYHFNPECHIRIEIDISGYVIDGVFS